MSKDINHLREHLFSQLDRLSDNEGMKNPIVRERELARAKEVANIAKSIIETAKVEVQFMKQMKTTATGFVTLEQGQPEQKAISSGAPDSITPSSDTAVTEEQPFDENGEKKVPKIKIIAANADAKLMADKPVIESPDLSKKVAVHIDNKTTIFINPDQDPEEAKANFLKNKLKSHV